MDLVLLVPFSRCFLILLFSLLFIWSSFYLSLAFLCASSSSVFPLLTLIYLK